MDGSPLTSSDSAAEMADLPTLLRTFRIQAGLSQQMLAERALISVQAVSALERGYRKVPYRKTLERIAEALALPDAARDALELSARRARGARLEEHELEPAHNLPRQLTSFLGRDEVIYEIANLVLHAPLVSIVGTGGAGKTRAAVEVGRNVLAQFPDGVWFVDLAPIGASLVQNAVAGALRIQESAQRPLLDTLLSYLARKRMLLIFDNCEHVISEARTVIGSILKECPTVALLATSREVLSVTGERAYRIPPLRVPARQVSTPKEALEYEAVALFADRIQAADTRFSLTEENVAPVVEICRRLDGLPLALELAAARSTVLSPQQICDRLDRVFELLSGNAQTAIPRHQTMRAAIDWSYALLSSQARLFFDRLSIFAGGFTLETATTVCTDESLAPEHILELISLLVSQSLLMVDFDRGIARYHLLEATRQYALEQLAKRGERQALSHRHARAFLEVAQRLDREWYAGVHERAWFDEAGRELDNFRMALVWSFAERNDLRSGRLLAGALMRVWYSLSPVEGRRWVRAALEGIDESVPADVLALLYMADAELCAALGEYKASLASTEQVMRWNGELRGLQAAQAKHISGSALGAIGCADEAETLLQQALGDAQRLGNRRLEALVLGELGTARSRGGDIEGARSAYAEALACYIALKLERPAASIAGNLAEVEFAAGDAAAALQRAEEARIGHQATQNRRSIANDLSNMAAYLVALDCFDDARTHAAQALLALRDVKQTVLTACVLQHVAAVAALTHYADARRRNEMRERAAMLIGFVDAWLLQLEAPREFTERQEYDRVMAALRGALGDRLDGLMARGAEWDEDGAIAVANDL